MGLVSTLTEATAPVVTTMQAKCEGFVWHDFFNKLLDTKPICSPLNLLASNHPAVSYHTIMVMVYKFSSSLRITVSRDEISSTGTERIRVFPASTNIRPS